MSKYITIKEAATRRGVLPTQIRRLVSQGRIRPEPRKAEEVPVENWPEEKGTRADHWLLDANFEIMPNPKAEHTYIKVTPELRWRILGLSEAGNKPTVIDRKLKRELGEAYKPSLPNIRKVVGAHKAEVVEGPEIPATLRRVVEKTTEELRNYLLNVAWTPDEKLGYLEQFKQRLLIGYGLGPYFDQSEEELKKIGVRQLNDYVSSMASAITGLDLGAQVSENLKITSLRIAKTPNGTELREGYADGTMRYKGYEKPTDNRRDC